MLAPQSMNLLRLMLTPQRCAEPHSGSVRDQGASLLRPVSACSNCRAPCCQQLTNQTHIDSRYSYGWHRAEILAALVNGVFLLALCFSIFLEAMERFFSTPGVFHATSRPLYLLTDADRNIKSQIGRARRFTWSGLQHRRPILVPWYAVAVCEPNDHS